MLILANRLDGGLDGSLSPHSTVVRPHMSDVPPQIMPSLYCSLPVKFDHIFSKRFWGPFLPSALSQKIPIIGWTFQSLSKSYDGEF